MLATLVSEVTCDECAFGYMVVNLRKNGLQVFACPGDQRLRGVQEEQTLVAWSVLFRCLQQD